MKHLTTLFFVLLFPLCVMGQEVFEWENPSFEENERGASIVPSGWLNFSQPKTNTPLDIQPGYFGCKNSPVFGKNYVGLVMRQDGSTESMAQQFYKVPKDLKVGQKAPKFPFKKDSFYLFSVWASWSPDYASPTPESEGVQLHFDGKGKLEAFTMSGDLRELQTLAQSEYIRDTFWHRKYLLFQPEERDLTTIGIKISGSDHHPLNGNILVDNVSAIMHIPTNIVNNKDLNLHEKYALIYNKSTGNIPVNNSFFLSNPNECPDNKWIVFGLTDQNVNVYSLDSLAAKYISRPSWRRSHLYLTANKNGLHSGVGQQLPFKISTQNTYKLEATLSVSDNEFSDGLLILKVWGGTQENPKQELLGETLAVNHTYPKPYQLTIKPKISDHSFLFLEATYATTIRQYNGNLIIHSCSDIKRIE